MRFDELPDDPRFTSPEAGCPVPLRPELLLHPQIPKPMAGVAPRVVLGQEWWDEQRKAAYAYTQYHCLACGVHQSFAQDRKHLEAHECYRIHYAAGRMEFVEVVALCHFCHCAIHSGRLSMMLGRGDVSGDFVRRVERHKSQMLARISPEAMDRALRQHTHAALGRNGMAPWETWRLVIGDKLFPPKFSSLEDWLRHDWRKGAADE